MSLAKDCPLSSNGVQVDSKSVENMTYAEVQELLESYSLKRWQCIITVQQNLEGGRSFRSHDHCIVTCLHLSTVLSASSGGQ